METKTRFQEYPYNVISVTTKQKKSHISNNRIIVIQIMAKPHNRYQNVT